MLHFDRAEFITVLKVHMAYISIDHEFHFFKHVKRSFLHDCYILIVSMLIQTCIDTNHDKNVLLLSLIAALGFVEYSNYAPEEELTADQQAGNAGIALNQR